jgi:hypothetical protein
VRAKTCRERGSLDDKVNGHALNEKRDVYEALSISRTPAGTSETGLLIMHDYSAGRAPAREVRPDDYLQIASGDAVAMGIATTLVRPGWPPFKFNGRF